MLDCCTYREFNLLNISFLQIEMLFLGPVLPPTSWSSPNGPSSSRIYTCEFIIKEKCSKPYAGIGPLLSRMPFKTTLVILHVSERRNMKFSLILKPPILRYCFRPKLSFLKKYCPKKSKSDHCASHVQVLGATKHNSVLTYALEALNKLTQLPNSVKFS